MRLDAMIGKSSVGVEKNIKEPTIQAAKNNIDRFRYLSYKNYLRKPYEIPASALMKHDKK